MNKVSYNALEKEEKELEQLKGKTYSLEDKACKVLNELFLELDKKEIKQKKKKNKITPSNPNQ